MTESEDANHSADFGLKCQDALPSFVKKCTVTSFSWSHEDGERQVGQEGIELPIVIKLARNGTVTMCISKQTPSVRANSYSYCTCSYSLSPHLRAKSC